MTTADPESRIGRRCHVFGTLSCPSLSLSPLQLPNSSYSSLSPCALHPRLLYSSTYTPPPSILSGLILAPKLTPAALLAIREWILAWTLPDQRLETARKTRAVCFHPRLTCRSRGAPHSPFSSREVLLTFSLERRIAARTTVRGIETRDVNSRIF